MDSRWDFYQTSTWSGKTRTRDMLRDERQLHKQERRQHKQLRKAARFERKQSRRDEHDAYHRASAVPQDLPTRFIPDFGRMSLAEPPLSRRPSAPVSQAPQWEITYNPWYRDCGRKPRDEKVALLDRGVLGEGGQGVVRLVEREDRPQLFAYKVGLRTSGHKYLWDLPKHPNVVQILATVHSAGVVGCLLEYCPSGELAAFSGRCSERFLKSVFRDIAGALSFVHEQGIVHRDVKAQNILFNGHRAKLGDFGSAIYWCHPRIASELIAPNCDWFPESYHSEYGDVYCLAFAIAHTFTGTFMDEDLRSALAWARLPLRERVSSRRLARMLHAA